MGEFSKYGVERRQFTRTKVNIPVRYKFLSGTIDVGDEIFAGSTQNISSGGMLLKAVIPNMDWLAPLLMGKILIGINMELPTSPELIKALAKVAWIEALEEDKKCKIGLKFREISQKDRDSIIQFVIRSQMPS